MSGIMLLEGCIVGDVSQTATVEVEQRKGSTIIGYIPVDQLIRVGDQRVLFRVRVEDEDSDGRFAWVVPCADRSWHLLYQRLHVYQSDLAEDIPSLPTQRRTEVALT